MCRASARATVLLAILARPAADCVEDFANFRPCPEGTPNIYTPKYGGDRATFLRLAAAADAAGRCCVSAGARIWQVAFLVQEYQERVGRAEAFAHMPGNGALFGIFCGPQSCGEEIGFLTMQRWMLERGFETPVASEAFATELATWQEVRLDFVILGMSRCGTTAMQSNLLRHPDIDFKNGWREDYTIFAQGQAHEFLPTKAKAVLHHAEFPNVSSRAKIGLRNPGIATYPLSYYTILQMLQHVKVILMVCDPVSRVEKAFLWYHWCHENWDAAHKLRMTLKVHAHQLRDCDSSVRALLQSHRQEWLNEMMWGRHLRELVELSGSRLLLVHLSSLRSAPQETYDRVSTWLGVAPMARAPRPRRVNFVKGHRTDLCKNRSLQEALKRRLTREYSSLQWALERHNTTFPQPLALTEVRNRITRCDMQEELVAGPCGFTDGRPTGPAGCAIAKAE